MAPSPAVHLLDSLEPATKPVLTLDVENPTPSINVLQSYLTESHGLKSVGRVNTDGQISIHLDLEGETPDLHHDHAHDVEEFGVDTTEWHACPKLTIVIMIVGSRGDVQPYVALGKRLVKDGHRIRIATHETFRQFVTNAGLEFFSIGGDPQDLMSYMVKNPGLVPGIDSLTNGDITKKRKMLAEMIDGCWESCTSADPLSGREFIADAIISNPPTFAHIHCAEALGIPLLLSFTMPWSPTIAFAHPLVNITTSNPRYRLSNYLSYYAADLLTWQGIGDIINNFRSTKLGLSPLNIRTGPGYVDRLKVPWTYCISPALVPKPADWKNHIDVVGFYFLDMATTYHPSPDLVAFLEAGPPPVYIGFGSVVVDDPDGMTKIIFEATEKAGVRALVSAGWGGLGGIDVPPHIFILGNIPHDWLFDQERVSAVVHHGGAGTTAIGLAKGRPTVVVPFFGDQPFWGKMIHKSGAGPKPIHHKDLTVKKLKDALLYATSPAAKEAAAHLAQKIHDENGVDRGVECFYKHLPLLNMRCDLDPSRLAVWWSTTHCLKLSSFAAQTLADANLISMRSLVLHRSKDHRPKKKVSDTPCQASTNALFHCVTGESKWCPTSSKKNKTDHGHHGILGAVASIHEGFKLHSHHKKKSETSSQVHETSTPHTAEVAPDSPLKSPITSVNATPTPRSGTVCPTQRLARSTSGLLGSFRQLVHPSKKGTNPSLATTDIIAQGVWRMLKSTTGQMSYHQQRLVRIAEGRTDVSLSTSAQRAQVINNFYAEHANTPVRQEIYRKTQLDRENSLSVESDDLDFDSSSKSTSSASSMVGTPSEEDGSRFSLPPTPESSTFSGSTLVSSPRRSNTEDDTSAFVREMEQAVKTLKEEQEQEFLKHKHKILQH